MNKNGIKPSNKKIIKTIIDRNTHFFQGVFGKKKAISISNQRKDGEL